MYLSLVIFFLQVFNSTAVSDIIWGFDHPLIKLGNDVLPPEKRLPFDKFGFFVNVCFDDYDAPEDDTTDEDNDGKHAIPTVLPTPLVLDDLTFTHIVTN